MFNSFLKSLTNDNSFWIQFKLFIFQVLNILCSCNEKEKFLLLRRKLFLLFLLFLSMLKSFERFFWEHYLLHQNNDNILLKKKTHNSLSIHFCKLKIIMFNLYDTLKLKYDINSPDFACRSFEQMEFDRTSKHRYKVKKLVNWDELLILLLTEIVHKWRPVLAHLSTWYTAKFCGKSFAILCNQAIFSESLSWWKQVR